MEAVLGLLGAAFGVVIFVCGYYLGRESNKAPEVEKYEPTEQELKAIKDERERLIKEQEAFKELMSYNTNMAYGVTANPLK